MSGVPQPKPATLVSADTPIVVSGGGSTYVGRGGEKLAGALDTFQVEVAGRRALDAGASTGGFTDCLLQRGASRVVAVDVGYGQLDWRLRQDPRVEVRERTNLRHVDPAELGAPFEVVVADLSFISLCTVADILARLSGPETDLVLLVKPQFEVGRGQVGKGGVVRDPDLRRRAVAKVVACLAEAGLGAVGVVRSTPIGASGNVEYFVRARMGEITTSALDLDTVVEP